MMETRFDVIVEARESSNEDDFNQLPVEKDLGVNIESFSFYADWDENPSIFSRPVEDSDGSLECLLSNNNFAVQYRSGGRGYPNSILIELENRLDSRWDRKTLETGKSIVFSVGQYRTLRVPTPSTGTQMSVSVQGGTRYAIVVGQNAWTISRIGNPLNG